MAKFKLDADGVRRAVKLKKGGAANKDIAAALCVTESTFSRWINEPKSAFQRQLKQELEKAEADYKNALLAIIAKNAQEKDWKAAAWLLERKYPREYSRMDRVQAEISGRSDAPAVRVEHYFDYGEGDTDD